MTINQEPPEPLEPLEPLEPPESLEHLEQVGYRKLIEALTQLVREQRTGTMFIVTDTHRSARFGLEQGRVVSCTYTHFRGLDALAHIRHIWAGKFTFSDGVLETAAELTLPDTFDLLQELGAIIGPEGLWSRLPPAPSTASEVATLNAAVDTGMAVTGKALWNIVVGELATDLGPVASLAAARYKADFYSATSGERFQAILSTLALEIGDPEAEQEFKERVMARILG